MRSTLTLTVLWAALLITACSRSQEDPRHQEVRTAAEQYCSSLIGQQADRYVEGLYGYARMAPEMQSQLKDAAAQFGHNIAKAAVKPVSVHATADSLWQDSAVVFLDILFADSTTEAIVLPMLCEDGTWKVR